MQPIDSLQVMGFATLHPSYSLIKHIDIMIAYALSWCLMKKGLLDNPANVTFADLLAICRRHFGEPRISGSHHIFKTPWKGDPRINLQRDGKMAKPYQVKDVKKALAKLEESHEKQSS